MPVAGGLIRLFFFVKESKSMQKVRFSGNEMGKKCIFVLCETELLT